MPIRFRCKYCNQLMGIARRKIGMEVECPTCKGKLVVPQVSAEPAPTPGAVPAPAAQTGSPPLFERSDFGDLFNQPQANQPVIAAPPPAAPPRPPASQPRAIRLPSSYDVEIEPMPGAMSPAVDPNAVGIVLTPGRATMLTVAIILGLALAFSLGLLVGKWL